LTQTRSTAVARPSAIIGFLLSWRCRTWATKIEAAIAWQIVLRRDAVELASYEFFDSGIEAAKVLLSPSNFHAGIVQTWS
jgi:hypothetical protein